MRIKLEFAGRRQTNLDDLNGRRQNFEIQSLNLQGKFEGEIKVSAIRIFCV